MNPSKIYHSLLVFCCALLVLSCNKSNRKPPAEKSKPNFVFILVDDMGWRDVGAYGSTYYQTPNIDNLAKQGMKFTDAYAACPVCSPSRYAIQTGKYPADIHLTDWIPGRQAYHKPDPWNKLVPKPFQLFMPLSEITIGEAMKSMGYNTFFAGKWHLGEDSLHWPSYQGYDINEGGWKAGNPKAGGMGGYFSPYHNPKMKDGPKGEYLPDRLTSETIKFIEQETKEKNPFFAFLSFYSVHQPIEAKPEMLQENKKRAEEMGLTEKKTYITNKPWMKYKKGWKERIVQSNPVYGSMVESVDQNVGRIMDKLKALNIDQNTVVFFFSDNGGLSTAEGSPTSNLPLRGGKGWMYEGGIREPLIVKWPGTIDPGSVSHIPVVGVDFYPTLLEMAGIQMNTHAIDGRSLMPILDGSQPQAYENRPLFWHYPHYANQGSTPASAVRKGDYKLIKFWEDQHVELYNLKEDIGEQHDLAQDQPEKTAELKKLLNNWLDSVNARIPDKNPNYDPNYMSGK